MDVWVQRWWPPASTFTAMGSKLAGKISYFFETCAVDGSQTTGGTRPSPSDDQKDTSLLHLDHIIGTVCLCVHSRDPRRERSSNIQNTRDRSGDTHQFHQLLQERNKLQKLVVISIHKPALNRNPVGKLQETRETQHPWSSITGTSSNRCLLYRPVEKVYLIGKGLGWVVDDYRLGKIPSENIQVFNIIPLNTHTVLTKQPMSKETREERTSVRLPAVKTAF